MKLWMFKEITKSDKEIKVYTNMSNLALGLTSLYKDLVSFTRREKINLNGLIIREIEIDEDDIEYIEVISPDKFIGLRIEEDIRKTYLSIRNVAICKAVIKNTANLLLVAEHKCKVTPPYGIYKVETTFHDMNLYPSFINDVYVDQNGMPRFNQYDTGKILRVAPYVAVNGMFGCPNYYTLKEAYDCVNDITIAGIVRGVIKHNIGRWERDSYTVKDILDKDSYSLIEQMHRFNIIK